MHDLGGMPGFGPVERDLDEPVFHETWEGRIFGILQELAPKGLLEPYGLRAAIESLDSPQYLESSYYERWLLVIEKSLLEKGWLGEQELRSRAAQLRSRSEGEPTPPVDAGLRDRTLHMLLSRDSPHREIGISPRFHVGDTIIVRKTRPPRHTRLPKYTRGKRGEIVKYYGVHDFHDVPSEGRALGPQPVYNVRFEARELWGDIAESNQSVHLDMWESYLGPA